VGRLSIAAVAATSFAAAQGLHFGAIAGVPLTHYFDTGAAGARNFSADYSAATRRYTVGIAVERGLAGPLGIEGDVLFHRMGYVAIVDTFADPQGIATHSAIDVKGDSWDFPLRVKLRLGGPYLAAGGVLRYAGPVRGLGERTVRNLITGAVTATPLDTSDPSELRKRFYPGVTAGAGIELGAGRVRIAPEFRYTRWTANIAGSAGTLRFTPNQAEFEVGFWF
jgi:hypothetical protein